MKSANTLKHIKDAKILDVLIKDNINGDENTEDYTESDYGDIYIVLDNGLVIQVWNSEWGGISLGKLKNERFVDEV